MREGGRKRGEGGRKEEREGGSGMLVCVHFSTGVGSWYLLHVHAWETFYYAITLTSL